MSIHKIVKKLTLKLSQLKNYFKKFAIELFYTISSHETEGTTRPAIKEATLFGMIVLLFFLVSFGLWSLLATLETAAIAHGKVIIATNRKTIQHLEGGIIKQIFVREGSVVKAGDPLVKLDDTQAKSTVGLLQNQANNLYATEARLIAERDHADAIQFPNALLEQEHIPDVKKLIEAQRALFDSNQKALKGRLEILQQRIAQLEKQIESYQAQVESSDKQLGLIEQELTAVQILEKKRLIEKTRLWALQREAARLAGNRDELVGSVAQTQQKIGETQQQIYTLKDTEQKEILSELSETQSKLTDILERQTAAKDVLLRTTITAPYDGVIVGLKEHTIGGVITPGKPILDIVPAREELIIEAHVNPLDIDSIHPGLIAKVQLIAYKRRSTPWVDGTVTDVSADIFEEPQTKQTYYVARITVLAKELKRLEKIKLYPGMPVEVMIITDKRTPWAYFFAPIKESFYRAFREQ